MQATDIVANLLSEMATEAGLPNLTLNEQGLCAFEYDGGLEFIVEVPQDSPIVYFYSPIIEIPAQGSHALFEQLLKLNFLCLETHGATLAIDERHNRIILCYGHAIDQLDILIFKNIVSNFLKTAEEFQTKLTEFVARPSDTDKGALPSMRNRI